MNRIEEVARLSGFIRRKLGGLWRSSLIDTIGPVVHGVSTRHGGVSQTPFDSLNVGLHVGDLREDVLCNRAILLKSVGFSPLDAVCAEQVHGTEVQEVTPGQAGAGVFDYATAIPGVDAMITSASGLVLMGYFADCTPILIAHKSGRWVGLAHAGWRGTLGAVAAKAVKELQSRGVSPQDLCIALGPRIQSCCYEIGDDLVRRFASAFGENVLGTSKHGRPTLDLAAANVHQLISAGVSESDIDVADECTACRHDVYFSHRVHGPRTGRMAAIIALSS